MRREEEAERAEAVDNDGMDAEDLTAPGAKDSRADEEPRDVDLPAEGAADGVAAGAGAPRARDAARTPEATREAADAARKRRRE